MTDVLLLQHSVETEYLSKQKGSALLIGKEIFLAQSFALSVIYINTTFEKNKTQVFEKHHRFFQNVVKIINQKFFGLYILYYTMDYSFNYKHNLLL